MSEQEKKIKEWNLKGDRWFFHQQHIHTTMFQWLLQVPNVGLRLCICVSKVLDCESKYRSLNLCCLWLGEGRKFYYQPSRQQPTHQNQPPSPVSGEHPKPHCYLSPRKFSLWLMMCFWFSESLSVWLLPDLPYPTQVLLLCLPHSTDSPGSQCWMPKTSVGANAPLVCKVILMTGEPSLNKQTLSYNKTENRDWQQNIGTAEVIWIVSNIIAPSFHASLSYLLQANKVLLGVLQGVNPPQV